MTTNGIPRHAENGRQLPAIVRSETQLPSADMGSELTIGESDIAAIINDSTIPMTDIVKSVADTIKDVEAEIMFDEDIVITRKAIRIHRSMKLAKDRR